MSQYGDHWKTLGLARDAGPDEIKAAFRKLALKLHPDRHASSAQHERTEAANRFKLITEAYEVLSNDKLRAAYKARHGGSSSSYTSSRSRGPGTAYPPGSGYPGSSSSSAWSSGSAGGAEAGYGYAYGQGSASYQSAYSPGYGYGASSSSSSRRSPWARGRYSWWSSFTRGVNSRKVEVAAGLGFSFFALLTYANVEAMWERRNAQKSFAAAVASRENLGVRTRRSSSREPPGKGSIDGGGSGGPGVQGGSDSAPRPGQGAPPVAGAGPMVGSGAAAAASGNGSRAGDSTTTDSSSSSRGGKGWAWGWGSRAAAPPAAAPHGAGLPLAPGAPSLSSAMATSIAMIPNTPAPAASLPAAQTPGATTAASVRAPPAAAAADQHLLEGAGAGAGTGAGAGAGTRSGTGGEGSGGAEDRGVGGRGGGRVRPPPPDTGASSFWGLMPARGCASRSRPYTPAYDPAPGPSSPGLMVVSAAERQQHLALMSLSELVALEEAAEAGPATPGGAGAGGQAAGGQAAGGQAAGAASQFKAGTRGLGSAAEGQAAGAGGQEGAGAAWRPGPGAGGQEGAGAALQSGAPSEKQGEGAAPLKSCPTDPGYRAASLEGNPGPVLEVAPSRDSLGAGQVGKAGGEGGVKPWQAAYVDRAVIIPGPRPPGQMAGACSRQPLPSRG